MVLKFKNNGFTLSEVMVTIGILGVIAAVVIPAVMKVTPSPTKVMFRKAYYVVEKTISNMSNDDVNYPSTELSGSDPRWFNYTTDSTYTGNKFCELFADQLNFVGTATCPDKTSATATTIGTTADGIIWRIYLGGSDSDAVGQFPMTKTASSYPTKIIMDVNGTKSPNCFTDSAYTTYRFSTDYSQCTDDTPDSFIIGVRYDGRLQVGSDPDNDTTAIEILSNPTDNTK